MPNVVALDHTPLPVPPSPSVCCCLCDAHAAAYAASEARSSGSRMDTGFTGIAVRSPNTLGTALESSKAVDIPCRLRSTTASPAPEILIHQYRSHLSTRFQTGPAAVHCVLDDWKITSAIMLESSPPTLSTPSMLHVPMQFIRHYIDCRHCTLRISLRTSTHDLHAMACCLFVTTRNGRTMPATR